MSCQTENRESAPAVSANIPTGEEATPVVEQPNQEVATSKRQRLKYSTAVTKHHPPFVKMIQRALNKYGKKKSDPGINKTQLYHYLRDTFGVKKGGNTPARVQKALHELRRAGKAKILEKGIWKAGVGKKNISKSAKSSIRSRGNKNASCTTLKTSKRAVSAKKVNKKVIKPKKRVRNCDSFIDDMVNDL